MSEKGQNNPLSHLQAEQSTSSLVVYTIVVIIVQLKVSYGSVQILRHKREIRDC